MLRINKNYLHLFKKIHNEYLYQCEKGVYLAFDLKDLEYIGIETYYLVDLKKVCKLEDITLSKLISIGALDT